MLSPALQLKYSACPLLAARPFIGRLLPFTRRHYLPLPRTRTASTAPTESQRWVYRRAAASELIARWGGYACAQFHQTHRSGTDSSDGRSIGTTQMVIFMYHSPNIARPKGEALRDPEQRVTSSKVCMTFAVHLERGAIHAKHRPSVLFEIHILDGWPPVYGIFIGCHLGEMPWHRLVEI